MRIRLVFGDPDSEATIARGREEEIDLAARVRLSLQMVAPLLGVEGIEVRLHAATLYNSIFRSDDMMLTNTHVYGAPAAQSPVLHLQQIPGGRLFDHYARSYERVWDQARKLD